MHRSLNEKYRLLWHFHCSHKNFCPNHSFPHFSSTSNLFQLRNGTKAAADDVAAPKVQTPSKTPLNAFFVNLVLLSLLIINILNLLFTVQILLSLFIVQILFSLMSLIFYSDILNFLRRGEKLKRAEESTRKKSWKEEENGQFALWALSSIHCQQKVDHTCFRTVCQE